MQAFLLHLFEAYPGVAVLISLCIGILVAVIGVVPGVFVTAANILFFGFLNGTVISYFGETIGAGIAFFLYRKGFKTTIAKGLQKYPRIKRLTDARNKEAFYLVFSLRLVPFVPSGLITFTAAVGKISFPVFFIASSLGKLPALLMEAYSVYQVSRFNWQGKIILALIALGFIFWALRKKD